MLKFFGVLFVFVVGIFVGVILSAQVILKDIKGDKELINKWIKKYGNKQTVLNDYVCMNCNWKKKNTKDVLDGISCPQCKGNTVIAH